MTALAKFRERLLNIDAVADICVQQCDDPKDKAEHERWRVSKKEELKNRLEKATKIADSWWRYSSQTAESIRHFDRMSDSRWHQLWHDDARVSCPSAETRTLARDLLAEKLSAEERQKLEAR